MIYGMLGAIVGSFLAVLFVNHRGMVKVKKELNNQEMLSKHSSNTRFDLLVMIDLLLALDDRVKASVVSDTYNLEKVLHIHHQINRMNSMLDVSRMTEAEFFNNKFLFSGWDAKKFIRSSNIQMNETIDKTMKSVEYFKNKYFPQVEEDDLFWKNAVESLNKLKRKI